MSYGKLAEAYVEIRADTTKFKTEVSKKIKNDLDKSSASAKHFAAQFGASMASASASLKSFGQQTTVMGRSLMRSLTLPLAGVGIAGVKMASDFESSMTKITALVGVAASDVKSWEDSVKELAVTYGKSANEAAEALFFITSAGLRGAEALDTLEASLKASAIGLGDTSTIADLATSAVNAYGSSVITASKATDILTGAVREGKLEASELSASMGAVLPFASQLGVSFDEVGATFAALSRTGTNAASAATQLRGIFASLIKPSSQANEQLEALGLSAKGVREQIKEEGLLATLETLTRAFGTNEEAAGRVFGNVRALAGVMDLMGANVDTTRAIFDNMAKSTNDVDKAFGVMEETAAFKLSQAFSEVKLAIQELGEALMPIVMNITSFVSAIARSIAGLSDTTKSLLVTFGTVAAIVGPFLLLLGKLSTMLGGLIGVVGKFSTALATLGGATTGMATKTAILTSAMGGLTVAIGIAAAAYFAYKKRKEEATKASEDFRNALTLEGEAQTEAIEKLRDSTKWWKSYLDGLVAVGFTIDDLRQYVDGATGKMVDLVDVWDEINRSVTGTQPKLEALAEALDFKGTDGWVRTAADIRNLVQEMIRQRALTIKNAEAQLIAAKAGGDFNEILKAQNDLLRANGQAHNNYNMILGMGATQYFALADAANEGTEGVGGFGGATSEAETKAKKLSETIKRLKQEMRSLFEDVIRAGKDRLDEARKAFDDFATSVGRSVTEIFNFGLAQSEVVANTQALTNAITAQTQAQQDAETATATAAQSAGELATAQNDLAKAQAEVERIRRTGSGLLSRALQRQEEAEAAVARQMRKATDDADALREAQDRLAEATQKVAEAQSKPMTFLEQLAQQADKASKFGGLVQQLIASGLSESALQQVLDAGVDAGTLIAEELLSSADGILQANTLAERMEDVARTTGALAAQKFRQEGVNIAQALLEGIQTTVAGFQIELKSKKLTKRQIKKLEQDFSVKVGFDLSSGMLGVPALANGAIVRRPQTALIGEAGAEAVIPITRPARALELLETSGLAALVRNNSQSASVSIQNATFTQPTDIDLLAQKVNAAAIARSL